jgi:nucleoside-diphosphate-sugar epimerase
VGAGGSGYIGGSIARELSKKYDVKIVDVKEPAWNMKDFNVSFCRCDIRSFECEQECLRDADVESILVLYRFLGLTRRRGWAFNIYGIIRLGTVLGEGMPEKTAANIFIDKGLKGEPLTSYKHRLRL